MVCMMRYLPLLLLTSWLLCAATPVTARQRVATPKVTANAVQPAAAASPVADNRPNARQLRSILLSAKGKPTAVGYVVDLDSGEVVFDLRGKRSIYPASVSKLFSTATVLRSLPLNQPLRTVVRAARKGKVARTLAIVGSGDPSLTSKDLAKLAKRVAASGIVKVHKLVVDATIFDGRLPTGYDEKQTDASYRAPVGGLQVNSGAVTIVLKAQKIGRKPIVELKPASGAFLVINEATTVKGRGTPLTVISSGAGKRTKIIVRGRFGVRRRRIATRRRVHNAVHVAGEAFRAALSAVGIKVLGKTSYASAPKGLKTIATHRSKPLIELVRVCNQTSHNGYAESFYKLAGAKKKGRPGSSMKGQQAAQLVLADLGLNFKRLRLRNGSGLYHANKTTARQVVTLLAGMDKLPRVGKAWRRTLAIAGVAGTLRGRLRGSSTKRRIYAKTGTLDDVTALAGYALGAKRRYGFALFFNDVKGPARVYRRVHDQFLKALLAPGKGSAKEN